LAPAKVFFPGELLHSCSSFSSISRVWRGSTLFPRTPAPAARRSAPGPWARGPCGRDLWRRRSCSAWLAGRPWHWPRLARASPHRRDPRPLARVPYMAWPAPWRRSSSPLPPRSPLLLLLMSMEFLREEEERKEEDDNIVI
jgi:hypothetical protein